ncbi:MAG: hypothetical protein KAT65_22245 [Methanophagales archaeon]|nr:hypothetical protein [Methanophagales archaeon]
MNIPNREEFFKGCEEFEKYEKRDAMYKVATFLVSHFWRKPADMANGLGVLLLTWNQAFYRYGIFDFDKLEECIIDNLQKIESFRNRDILSLSNTDEKDIKDLFAKFLEALQIDRIRFSDKNKKRDTQKDLESFLRKIGIEYEDSDNLETLYNSIKNNQKIKNGVVFISKEESNSKKDYIEIKISQLESREGRTLESLGLIRRSPVSVTKTLHLLAPSFFPLWDDKIARAYECYYNENPAEKYVSFCKITKIIADKVKNYIDKSDRTLKLIDEYNYSKYTQGWI